MSSLSKQERIGLEDVFISLGKKEKFLEKVKEQQNRLFDSINLIAKRSIPFTISLIKSKKNILKMEKTKLFKQFRPKSRDSK